ncbi:MAG: FtsX-like permease family protein [Bacteroidetes bacterium]|nr:MAG: FtsX-like permease family protein [Bacteroidota bacterium]
MNGPGNTYQHFAYFRRRSRNTYLTTLLSMSLVLFFLGLFACITVFSHAFISYARESIVMKVFLHDGIDSMRQQMFIEELASQPYVRSFKYVSKEEVAKLMKARTGEDVLALTDGVNPFLASLDIQLKHAYLRLDSLKPIKAQLESELLVAEVDYPAEMIEVVSQRVNMLGFLMLGIGILLISVAFYLIFGTIRLSIFAQRLNIRSMQLIGATNAFIRRPFLMHGLVQGTLASLIASGLLGTTLWLVQARLAEVGLEQQFTSEISMIAILGGIVLFGSLLGFTGSYFAVNRYLNKNLDELM